MQFKDVTGLQEQKDQLIREARQGTVSHAKLFHGKAGFGGLPLALAFVQYLFCEHRQELDSCGACPSCKKVIALQHPDLHFSFPVVQSLGKTSDQFIHEWRKQVIENPYFSLKEWLSRIDEKERRPIIGTEESQDILRKLSLKSFEGGYKIMIIWMSEEMNTHCSNKLLKMLEEPPKDTVFILLAEQSEQLLPTIVSRTQTLRIPRLHSEDLRIFLQHKGVRSAEVEGLVARSEGDLVLAAELIDHQSDQNELRERFIQLMRVCYKKDVIPMLDWAETTAMLTKERQKIFLEYSLHMFRQSILKNYTDDQLIRVSADEELFLKNFSKFITGKNLADFMKTFNDAHYHLERNANAKILFMSLCFKVMRYIHFA